MPKIMNVCNTDYAIERFDIAGDIIYTVMHKSVLNKSKPEEEHITSYVAIRSFTSLEDAEEHVQSLL